MVPNLGRSATSATKQNRRLWGWRALSNKLVSEIDTLSCHYISLLSGATEASRLLGGYNHYIGYRSSLHACRGTTRIDRRIGPCQCHRDKSRKFQWYSCGLYGGGGFSFDPRPLQNTALSIYFAPDLCYDSYLLIGHSCHQTLRPCPFFHIEHSALVPYSYQT